MTLTCDEPASGLRVWQPERGYRYALDPFLLAGFALEGGRPRSFLDVGTGSGIVALLLARLGIPGTGLDVRPEWVALARRSAADSGIAGVSFVEGDMREVTLPRADLVLANPPYRTAGTRSPDPMKAAATFELAGTLDELVAAMARLGDRVALVVPAAREGEARAALTEHGLARHRVLRLGGALALVDATSNGSQTVEEAPLRVDGAFGDRVRALYEVTGAHLAAPGHGV